jgi:hypothetical protein
VRGSPAATRPSASFRALCSLLQNCDILKPNPYTLTGGHNGEAVRARYTGHKEYDFTPNSPAAKRAEKIFNKLMNKGYVGGKRMADGSLKKIRKFDPTAEEILVHRQLVGG